MTLLPTFLAGTNFVMHAAGWLEGGLVSCYEKFIVDIELLRMLRVEFTPLEIDEASLAFGAHEEVGHGGHFLGAAHTMERFRECFYRPLLSSTANYERWLKQGGKDTTARAGGDLRQDARGVPAAAAGRRDPGRARRLRNPPPRRAGRLGQPVRGLRTPADRRDHPRPRAGSLVREFLDQVVPERPDPGRGPLAWPAGGRLAWPGAQRQR